MTSPAEHFVRVIDDAYQHIKVKRMEIDQAARQLGAITQFQGVTIEVTILDDVLPETNHRVVPILNRTGRLPYLGNST
jgi:hypothetical protein